jgi:hypothetical protein
VANPHAKVYVGDGQMVCACRSSTRFAFQPIALL